MTQEHRVLMKTGGNTERYSTEGWFV